jgi:DNA primase
MKFEGREIDAIALWSDYVEFPPGMKMDGKYLPLVQCPNPNHDTQKHHFQINVEDGLVHCFAQCGISGTFARAISIIEGCSERDARKTILGFKCDGRVGRKSYEKHEPGRNVSIEIPTFSTYLPSAALEYLNRRGIAEESVARWGLGWDQEELRIVIPAQDSNGTVRFLIKRAVRPKDHPKYLYAPEGVEKNSLLFGCCGIDTGMVRSQGIVLVEGSIDAIRLYQEGFQNVVATLGTGISEKQCEILSRLRPKRVYCFFDKDVAGVHGIEIVKRRLRKYPVYVCRYPKGKSDPAECEGREVKRAIDRAVPLSKLKLSTV